MKTRKNLMSEEESQEFENDVLAGAPKKEEPEVESSLEPEEPAPAEEEPEAEPEEKPEEKDKDLKDMIADMTVMIKQLQDEISELKNKKEETEEEEPAEGEESAPAEDEQSEEPADGEGEGESSDGEDADLDLKLSDDEGEEEAPKDETKSEAYNYYMKKGRILHEGTGSMLGYIRSGKTWKLEEGIMKVARVKLNKKINECKSNFRAKLMDELLP